MHGASKVLWSFELTFDECLVDDHFRRDVGEFGPLPALDLPSHRLEIALYPVDTNRDAIDQRERLRVFCEHGSEHAANGQDDR